MGRNLRTNTPAADTGHVPMMSHAEALRRIAWQDKVYKEHLRCPTQLSLDFLGRKLVVHRNVFAPVSREFNLMSTTVLKEVKERDAVLDMGTGSGIQAILAASKAKRVLAVDVNPDAVRCARRNVALNGLTRRVKVLRSNVFEKVRGRFDLILFDPPFRWTAPRDLWEICSADEGYETLRTFLREGKRHLTKNGRIIVSFGTSGDIAYLKHLIRQNGFRREQLLKKHHKQGWIYFTFRLTR
jgi:release factor glutamine methyltransferase